MQPHIQQAIAKHQLPIDFAQTVSKWYQPIALQLSNLVKQSRKTLVLGVQGTQGSGKSTLADFLKLILENEYKIPTASLSIDDFYLTRADRKKLAKDVHPLLMTRGVPGTHDVELAKAVIKSLGQLHPGESFAIPRFNKALDDRAKKSEWDSISGPVKVVIFEGWCVGISPQDENELVSAINELERFEDPDACWRKFVNSQLTNEYKSLFNMLDALAVLSAPSFDCVFDWRLLQEKKLKEKWEKENPNVEAKIQSPAQIKRFISHYQRLTEHGLRTLPKQADWQLKLDSNHNIINLYEKDKDQIK